MIVTPGILKETVAAALGLRAQLPTIDVHLRNLREAGLIAKQKRGRGAAEMGPGDAVNLLLAVAGSEYVRDSVRSVDRYGKLPCDPSSITVQGLAKAHWDFGTGFLPLMDLPEGHAFSAALRSLLVLLGADQFLGDDLRRLIWQYTGRRTGPATEYLFVTFYAPQQAAMIQYGSRRTYHVQMVYGSLPVRDPRGAWDLRNFETDGSLITMKVIDRPALMRVAKAIA